MGVEATPKMLERLLWAVVTGYGSRTADGRRRDALPPCVRRRSGLSWLPREDHALRMALGGEGRQRTPPCDADYISAVLRRTPEEVVQRWDQLNSDALSREGFFK